MSRPRSLRVSLLLLAALLLVSVSAVVGADPSAFVASSASSDVVTLTDKNFDELTATGSWLLDFYAPWCGHCKALTPVWEKAASELSAQPIRLGKVDCTAETGVASRHGIRGYPTIKFMRDGVARPYNGGRALADLTSFAKRMTEPAVRAVRSGEEVEAAVGKDPAVFVFVGDDAAGKSLYASFSEVAHSLQGQAAFLHFPAPTAADLAKFGAQPATPAIVYLSRGQERPELLTGAVSSSELSGFVSARRLPLVSTLSADNFDELTNSPKRLALLVLPSSFSQPSSASSLIDSLYPLARRYRSSLLVATVDGAKYSRWLQQFLDTQQSKLPALLLFDDYPDTVWKPDAQPMGEDDIGRMLSEAMDGSRAGQSSTKWYSPQRYLRPLNKWLLQFEEWQLIAGVVATAVTVLGSVILLTTHCMADDAPPAVQNVAARAERELSAAKDSGVAAAKRLAKAVDRVAEAVLHEPTAEEKKAAQASKEHKGGDDNDEEQEDEEEEQEISKPQRRKGKASAK